MGVGQDKSRNAEIGRSKVLAQGGMLTRLNRVARIEFNGTSIGIAKQPAIAASGLLDPC
jgi:hypothetical protein